jgi:phosphoadenosine phosphosulfate reductase
MIYSGTKLESLNEEFQKSAPEDVVKWAANHSGRTIASSHFGPHEAVILHLISKHAPETPIVWVDHGYNTHSTYKIAEELTNNLGLNVQVYTPLVTAERRRAVYNGVPDINDENAHKQFVDEVKIAPFLRAFDEIKPDIWLTSLRKEQTENRASMDILTEDKRFNCIKVSPLFYWTELDMEEYLVENDLPFGEDYHDPTKVLSDRECGLHLAD